MIGNPALKRAFILFAGIWFVLLFCVQAEGIVLHTNHDPNLATWTDRPHTAITGRWGENASCIAVAPNYVITTKHQGGSLATPVTIDGVTYSIDEIINYPNLTNPSDPNHYKIDLRLIKLNRANLENYADIYNGTNEISINENAILTGYGLARDDTTETKGQLLTDDIPYGYQWQNRNIYKNFNLRYATNEIETVINDNNLLPNYCFDVLVAYFDEPGETIYEGCVAEFDSGGGWFIKTEGDWKLVALNWGTSWHSNPKSSWFRDNIDPNTLDPDSIIGLRLTNYASWIISNMEPVCDQYRETDFNGDCVVDTADLLHLAGMWLDTGCDASNNFCELGDLFRDGVVNVKDFGVLAGSWLEWFD